MPFDDKPIERQNLHVPMVLAVCGEHHKLNRPHLMDEDTSNHRQTRHIYVHEKSTEYRLHAAEKRDSLARVRRGLSERGSRVSISTHVFARIKRPNRLSNTQQTLQSIREKRKAALNRCF